MKYIDLRKKIKNSIFTLHDLKMLGLKLFGYQISLWQRQGHIVKLKNGIYAFEEKIGEVLPEEIARVIYSPSYISLEKALSSYGFIPEMVYSITSVTPKIPRIFKNRIGTFTYRHIRPVLFFGYKEVKIGSHKYLMAEPEKALLDYIYLNLSKFSSKEDISSARFNIENIRKTISRTKVNKYLKSYINEKVARIVNWVFEEK